MVNTFGTIFQQEGAANPSHQEQELLGRAPACA